MTDLDDLVRGLVRESKQARRDPQAKAKQDELYANETASIRANVEETRRKKIAEQWVPTELVLLITSSQCRHCGVITEWPNPHLLVSCRNERWKITDMRTVREAADWKRQFAHLPKRREYRTMDSDVCLHCFDSIGATDAPTQVVHAQENSDLLSGRADTAAADTAHTKPSNGSAETGHEVPDRQQVDQQASSGATTGRDTDRRERPNGPPSLRDLLGDFI